MATIQISNIAPNGSDLFLDSETYLTDLTVEEMAMIEGEWGGFIVRSAIRLGRRSSWRCVRWGAGVASLFF